MERQKNRYHLLLQEVWSCIQRQISLKFLIAQCPITISICLSEYLYNSTRKGEISTVTARALQHKY